MGHCQKLWFSNLFATQLNQKLFQTIDSVGSDIKGLHHGCKDNYKPKFLIKTPSNTFLVLSVYAMYVARFYWINSDILNISIIKLYELTKTLCAA